MNIQATITINQLVSTMGFQRQCPSCTKYVSIPTVEGKYETTHRCGHCGFVIRIPPKEHVMKSADYGD